MSSSRPSTSTNKRLLDDVVLTSTDTTIQSADNEIPEPSVRSSQCRCSAIFMCYCVIAFNQGALETFPSSLSENIEEQLHVSTDKIGDILVTRTISYIFAVLIGMFHKYLSMLLVDHDHHLTSLTVNFSDLTRWPCAGEIYSDAPVFCNCTVHGDDQHNIGTTRKVLSSVPIVVSSRILQWNNRNRYHYSPYFFTELHHSNYHISSDSFSFVPATALPVYIYRIWSDAGVLYHICFLIVYEVAKVITPLIIQV